MFPVFLLVGVLLIPGVWDWTVATAEHLFTPSAAQTATH